MNKNTYEEKLDAANLNKSHEIIMKNHLKWIGVKKGYSVLDFGCGDGKYAIPIARFLGMNGKVFALDEDQSKLEQLKANAKMAGVEESIHIIKTDGQLEIPLENEIIDITLLYNVACCIIGKDNFSNMQKLIMELSRITKNKGKVILGIKEGKTMEKRADKVIPLIQDTSFLKRKKKGCILIEIT